MPSNLLPDKNPPVLSIQQNKTDKATVERLAIGATVSLIGKVLGRGIDFAKQIALARLLNVEAFGLYALIWNLLRVVGVLAPLGLQNGVIQFAVPFRSTDKGKFKDVILRSLELSLIVSIGLTILLWWAAPWLASNLFDEPGFVKAFRVFVLTLPPMVGLRIAANATRISQRMQYAIYAEELLQSISALLLFLLLFIGGWQLLGAIWATTLSFLLAFGLSCYYLYRLFPSAFRLKRQPAVSNKILIAYSAPTALSGLFGVVVNRLDRLFIGYYGTMTDVGIYQAAAQFSIIFAVVLDGFNAIFSPIIAELHHKNRFAELQEIFRISTKWSIYANTPFFLIIFFAPYSVMEGIFGTSYRLGVAPLLILTIGQVVNISVGGVGRLLIMTGKQNAWFFTSSAMMLLSVVLNVVLIPRWGVVGAATATAASISLLYFIGLFQTWVLLRMWPYDARYKKGVAATGITIIGLLLMRLFPQPAALLDLFITTVLSCGLFFGSLLIIGLDEEDRSFFQYLKTRITGKK
jgi:O-antigen/teichoic acid export membrane protein